MKKIIILFLVVISTHVLAHEEKTVLRCDGARCIKETKITSMKDNVVEIKLEEITPGICLVNLEKDETFKVLEADQKSKKVIMIQEVSDGDFPILKRILKFYNDKSFNRNLRILPCEQTETKVLISEEKTKACLSKSSKYAQKYYCEKERLTNF